MTAARRLADALNEATPTGTFGGPRPPLRPWTPQEQYEHRRTLLDALNGWDWNDPYNTTRRTRERDRYQNRTPTTQEQP
ncbi:hypothetical protein [Streptomyces sp. NPDC058872]|uniref:hypothetical protein n=1 Tax=Streptomyces sp. NPDC058872 TaxID=3346661 RepID=UPI0036C9354C